jgi:hypothetical protein
MFQVVRPQPIEEIMEVEERDEEGNDDEGKMEGEEKVFHDPTAEFMADIRNALGDMAAVDSDQVWNRLDTRSVHYGCVFLVL